MKKLPATFYQSARGATPSLDWIRSLSKAEQKAIGTDIAVVEFGWPIGMPTCRAMGKGLYEIRTDLPSGTIARVFFCIHKDQIVLLHGIIKKTQKTPAADLALAIARQREVERQ